nr:pollen-specific leucine-rich repeat extensin-like protein 1 [Aegilops tauschii subsp. strangulata]
MCTYTGGEKDSLRHNSAQLSDEAVNEMVKSLLNEDPEDCVKAKSEFWKAEYDHEAAKKARAAKKAAKKTAKKTTKKKKKPSASDLLKLDDTSELTWEPAKQLKKSGQAKPNKKAKVTKPTEAPKIAEPEQQVPTPEASNKQPEETATDPLPEISDLSRDHTDATPVFPESSNPFKPPKEHGEDVIITGTGFKEPGHPTVLAKHSAKDEDATAELESQLIDAKTRLATQETKTRKAESKFQFSVAKSEKLKINFEAEKKTWAEEKTALTQRAEKAEAALHEVTTELSGLKRRVSQMVSAIFGPRSSNLNQDMLVKLKAVYTLVEQLFKEMK